MKDTFRPGVGFRLPRLKTALAAALLAASSSLFAANYFVVVPVPAKTTTGAKNITVSLASYSLPAGLQGQPYSGFDFKRLLSVTGDPQYTGYGVKWSVTEGSLPAGLTLKSDGTLSGTPTAAGTSSFKVLVSYETKAGEQAYQVVVASLTVSLAAATPPQAQVGQAYSYNLNPQLSVVGDPAFNGSGVTWNVVSSSLPAGLYLTNDGWIGGTPTAGGAGVILARATYRGINGQQSYQVVSLNIAVGLAASTPPQALVGQTYSYNLNPQLSVTGDTAYSGSGVTWSVDSSSLPAGLYLTNDGWIGGTPTAAGTGAITARATYRGVNGEQTYQVVSLNIVVGLAAATPPQALVGQAYSYNLNAQLTVSGDPAYSGSGVMWSVLSSNLPAGLYLTNDGRIAGTPTAAGTGSVTAQAAYRGANGKQAYQVVSLDIAVSLSSATPIQGTVGSAYSYDLKPLLSVTGDSGYAASSVTWSLASGNLPAGLSLGSNGVISGTPTTSTTATFQIMAAYRSSSGQQTYQLFVANMPANGTLSVTALTYPGQAINTTSTAQSVTMTNTGGLPLTVSSVTGSGPYTVANTCPASLGPNQSCSASATFKPTAVGTQTGSVVFGTGVGSKTVTLSGLGQGTTLSPSSTTVNLGNVGITSNKTPQSTPSQTISVTNTGNIATTALTINAPSTISKSTTCGSVLAAGASCSVTFSWAPTAAGTLNAPVTLTTQDATAQVTVTGTAVQNCTAGPTPVLAQSDTPVSVPLGCGHMQAELWGAGGGGALGVSAPGGGGGYTIVTGVAVSSSTTLVAKVGAGGLYGNANYAAGGGGGGTFLWMNGYLQVAAGGGGGAGGFATLGTGLAGAPGGGATGGSAANQLMNNTYWEYGGVGGSQSAGGAARPGTANINCGGGAGSYNTGGSSVSGCSTPYSGTVYGGGGSGTLGGTGNGGAGGGGGGYYGGSGGAMGGYQLGGTGGGGGSGWFTAGLNGATYAGSGNTPANPSNAYRAASGAGLGNAAGNGNGGELVFTWSQ
jgi:hypothetical protein